MADLKLMLEIKEAWKTNYPPRTFPGHYPSKVRHIVFICYPHPAPLVFITSITAIKLAKAAMYYQWQAGRSGRSGRWQRIGDWRAFLRWLQQVTRLDGYQDYKISLRQPFPAHREFQQWETYQIRPWNELIRWHFDQTPYIGDVDLTIEMVRCRKRT